MLQQALFDSRFVKADVREAAEGEGYAVRTSAFGSVARISDIYLSAGSGMHLQGAFPEGSCLLLPIAGEVFCTIEDKSSTLQPGQVYSLSTALLPQVFISNAFEDETINLLLIETALPATAEGLQSHDLRLNAKNRLTAPEGASVPLLLGLYDSRTKDRIELGSGKGMSLSYVINGSFEIEERLLEHRDALLVWNLTAVEFESLSEAAIILNLNLSGTAHSNHPFTNQPSEPCTEVNL